MRGFIGNQRVFRYLKRALLEGRAHAYLLHGPRTLGKHTAALFFASHLLDTPEVLQHPDFLLIEPDEKNRRPVVTIAQAREIRRFLALTPVIAKGKVVIVDGVERLTSEAANALLKTLEEPPGKTTLFLIAHETSRLLPTIRSRTLPVRFSLVPESELTEGLRAAGFVENVVAEVVALADGRPGHAITLAHDADMRKKLNRRRSAIRKLLRATPLSRLIYIARASHEDLSALPMLPQVWLSALRENMLAEKKSLEAATLLRDLLNADRAMQMTNVSPELALETALLGNEKF